MEINLTKDEKSFLIESLKYAEMCFDGAVANYPDFAKIPNGIYQEKKAMFKKIKEKIQSC